MTATTSKPKIKVTYELTECGRCGGSGRYAWNPRTADRCFGCNGSGKALTKAGAKAQTAFRARRSELVSIPVTEVQAGTRVKVEGKMYRVKSVSGIQVNSHKIIDGERIPQPSVSLELETSKGSLIWGMGVEKMVELAPTPAQWDELVAYARTLKGAILIEEPVA